MMAAFQCHAMKCIPGCPFVQRPRCPFVSSCVWPARSWAADSLPLAHKSRQPALAEQSPTGPQALTPTTRSQGIQGFQPRLRCFARPSPMAPNVPCADSGAAPQPPNLHKPQNPGCARLSMPVSCTCSASAGADAASASDLREPWDPGFSRFPAPCGASAAADAASASAPRCNSAACASACA